MDQLRSFKARGSHREEDLTAKRFSNFRGQGRNRKVEMSGKLVGYRLIAVWVGLVILSVSRTATSAERPNILFFFVDDWGRYASVYADPASPSFNDIVSTPHFDRVAREGVRFDHAFVPVSSCGPCRASVVTGRYFWNCGSRAFLNGRASDWKGINNPFSELAKFPDRLRDQGYLVRRSLKTLSFAPSKPLDFERSLPDPEYHRYGLYVGEAVDPDQRQRRIAETLEHPRPEMRRVLQASRESEQPFFFVYGTYNVHRPFHVDSGRSLWGIEEQQLRGHLPPYLPDVEEVRRDFADYLGEVQAADAMLGVMIEELEAANELDHTLIVLSGDNGIPGVPRGKTNCYDLAIHAPLMCRLPGTIPAGRVIQDFVSLMDLGPTLLELTESQPIENADGRSFLKQLTSQKSGWVDPSRDRVVVGRELHFHSAREGHLPYPMRAIRTPEYLYIRNFKADRWPMGAPYNLDTAGEGYEDLEESPWRDLDSSLTKSWFLHHRDTELGRRVMAWSIDKRPQEEFYDLRKDPHQLQNLAEDPAYAAAVASFREQLDDVMRTTEDPRLQDEFDRPPWVQPVTPAPSL